MARGACIAPALSFSTFAAAYLGLQLFGVVVIQLHR